MRPLRPIDVNRRFVGGTTSDIARAVRMADMQPPSRDAKEPSPSAKP
jgi:hypothetical protein